MRDADSARSAGFGVTSGRPVDLLRPGGVVIEGDRAPRPQASDDPLRAPVHIAPIDTQHLGDRVERLAVEQHGEDREVLVLQARDGSLERVWWDGRHDDNPPAVVVYSAYAGPALTLAARAAQADAVVDKAEPVQALLTAVRRAARGDGPPSPRSSSASS
jgi:hypothetical protein